MFANNISSRKVSISGVSSIRFATEGILLASEHMGRIFIIKCQHHQPLEKCNPKATTGCHCIATGRAAQYGNTLAKLIPNAGEHAE